MKPVLDNWNIVLVGAWNNRIFNVDWLSEYIFQGITINASISLVPYYPTKFTADSIDIIPTDERLLLQTSNISDDALNNIENKTRKILELLSHTPVNAVGINMTYRVDSPPADLMKIFSFSDSASFVDYGFISNSCSISRSFPDGECTINLILTEKQGVVDLQFNFHKDVADAKQADEFLNSHLVSYKNKSLDIAQTIYNLELEED